jgi:endo-1,4-beta-xylanase
MIRFRRLAGCDSVKKKMSFYRKSSAAFSNSLRFARDEFCLARIKFFLLPVLTLSICASCQPAAKAGYFSFETSIRKAKNETALAEAKQNIEKYRKGTARIKVLDANGKTVRQARLKIKQISHDFKFGCYLKIDDLAAEKLAAYQENFARLFNYAVIGTYWDFIENQRGVENWTWFERESALAENLKAGIQAAPVLWGTNEYGTPAWLPKDRNELLRVLERRVKSAVTRDAHRIADWEIVNEPLAPKPDVFAQRIGTGYIESAFLWAREAAPEKRLMINEYGVFGSIEKHNYNRDKYLNLLNELKSKNVPFDVIGIQAHANGEWYEPSNVAEQLERYAALGKPIQITEFSAQTLEYDDRATPLGISGAYKSGVWTAEKQAEFYREFYTVSFSVPQVEAIVAWGLDDARAWLPGIGLIDENEFKKPNYLVLERLINEEWRTDLELNTINANISPFRGFYGVYEVEVSVRGKSKKAKFELKKDFENYWIVKF